jgi:molybdopterin/thiamine biosynthesis adenylyltransferase
MADIYLHETVYRGPDAMETIRTQRVEVCGAGALGSLLVDNLARQGFQRLAVADFDRVEPHNSGTQLYGRGDVGARKVDALRALCFRNTGVEIETYDRRIDQRSVKRFLSGTGVVIDTTDNSDTRRLIVNHCRETGLDCLHLGMNADFGQAHWNEGYRVPQDVVDGDVCDYPLARNLILLLVAVGAEVLLQFLLDGQKVNRSITLRDLSINNDTL